MEGLLLPGGGVPKMVEKNSRFENSLDDLIRQSKSKKDGLWEGIVTEYLSLIHKNPKITQSAPSRIYDMVSMKGTSEVIEFEKLPHYEDMVRYNFFTEEIFGIEEVLHDLVRFFRAGASRTETGKRILILVGPVSSGKSTIAALLRRGLEKMETPIYAIKDCPIHEEPLHLVPRSLRPEFEKLLGVKIEGDLCPVCKYNLTSTERYQDHSGNYKWEDMPVVQIRLSRKGAHRCRDLSAVGPEKSGHFGIDRPCRPG